MNKTIVNIKSDSRFKAAFSSGGSLPSGQNPLLHLTGDDSTSERTLASLAGIELLWRNDLNAV